MCLILYIGKQEPESYHSRKMNVSPDVNFEELSRSTDDFNGAQCKAKQAELQVSV
jgi:ATP-dependent 26S proteasome regulatory subunit